MPDITDAEAIQLTNKLIRVAADKLASLYYECDFLKDLKVAIGDTPTFIALHEGRIRLVADLTICTIGELSTLENVWFNVGTPTAMNVTINNSAAFTMADGAPGDGRPPITGQDVHNIASRAMDLKKWLADAAFGGDGSGVNTTSMTNTMVVCGDTGNTPLQDAQVNTFVDNRCGEVVTEYEATGNLKLTQLLAVAPNPRTPA